MAVNNILDEIENLIVEGKHIVFTNKSIIDEPDLIRLVDELRQELPQQLQQAEQIMKAKDDILAEARDEAQRIVEQAKEYASKLVDESAVVRQSQEKAQLVMEQAKAQEQEILERTTQMAQERCDQANQYANQVFDHILTHITTTVETLQQGELTLQQAKEALNQVPVEPPEITTPAAPEEMEEEA